MASLIALHDAPRYRKLGMKTVCAILNDNTGEVFDVELWDDNAKPIDIVVRIARFGQPDHDPIVSTCDANGRLYVKADNYMTLATYVWATR